MKFAAWVVLFLVGGAFDLVFASEDRQNGEKQQRVHLAVFKILKDGAEMDARAHLDLGVQEVRSEGGEKHCEILFPSKLTASEEPWKPFDFYTEVKPDEVDKFKGSLGRPDFFFPGDDRNRNNSDDPFHFTRELAGGLRGSLEFRQLQFAESKERLDVIVGFRRGPLKFDGRMRAVTFLGKDGCDAGLLYCTRLSQTNGETVCAADGWTHRILEIHAIADVVGYLADKRDEFLWRRAIPNKDRRDVHSLVAIALPVSDSLEDSTEGEPLVLTLIKK